MKQLFLRLIQPFPIRENFHVGEKDLIEIKDLSHSRNMFPLIYTQLQRHVNFICPEQSVGEFLDRFKGFYLKSIAISARQESVETDILSRLRGRGISAVVIKGNQIAGELYGDPNCRISSDIDILIRREDAVMADSLLKDAGYIAEEGMPLAYCLSRIHHASYNDPLNNMPVEIHWGFGVPCFFNLSSREIWQDLLVTSDGPRLSPETMIIMLLIHHHSHAFRELKILVDILWALHKYEDGIDWQAFSRKIQVAGLVKTMLIAIEQIRHLWPQEAGEMKSVRILYDKLKKAGGRIPLYLSQYFRMDLDGDYAPQLYKDKLVARFALDKFSTTVLSFLKTLFPVPGAIKELYGDSRNLTLPVNYLKFITWRVGEWTRKTEAQ